MQILFKITAHFGYKSHNTEVYYVVAKDSVTAENMVSALHKKKDYSDVDYCHSEVVAKTGDYGKPFILLV